MGDRANIRARIATRVDELHELAPAWWALTERAANPQPVSTPLWLITWWSVFGGDGGRKLRTLVLETPDGEVVGIVPLLRRWTLQGKVVPVAVLELLGSGEPLEDEICSEYIGPIVARGFEEPVARAFAEVVCSGQLGSWDELSMPRMSGEDPALAPLVRALRDQGIQVETEVTYECPYVTLPRSWDDYVAGLDGDRRYFVRRTLRDLEAWAGPSGIVLRRATTGAELAEGWEILRELHGERWRGGGVYRSEPFSRFHRMVGSQMLRGQGGTLDLLWLEVAGSPIAALHNIVYRGHVQFYQSGRSLRVPKPVRPGIALHLLAIRRAIAEGHTSYDLLASADPYKRQLAPAERHHLVTLSAVAPTLRARASSDVRRTARELVRAARDFTASRVGRGPRPAP